MSTSERLLEIAYLHALLHYGPNFSHKPCDHPVRSIPSQNFVQFRNRLQSHDSLVPKLTDRRSDRGDRADSHCGKLTNGAPRCELRSGGRGNWHRWYHLLHTSKHQAARLLARPQCDDDKAKRICDQRLKVANSDIGKNITLVPCGRHVWTIAKSSGFSRAIICLPPRSPTFAIQRAMDNGVKLQDDQRASDRNGSRTTKLIVSTTRPLHP